MARPVSLPTAERPAVTYPKGARHPLGSELLPKLASRLTVRDRWLLRMLFEHRVLTTHHVTDLAFDSPRATTARLRDLWYLRAVDRFRPHRPVGSFPWHLFLDTTGAQIIAAEEGVDVRDLGYRHNRAAGIGHSLKLTHDVGVNTVFTALIAHARTHPGARLLDWWSERRCAHHWGDLVRPDAYGRWREPDPRGRAGAVREVEFLLEYDTGTEDLGRLTTKLDGYHQLAAGTGSLAPVLFVLHSPRREHALHRRLNTTTPDAADSASPRPGRHHQPAHPRRHKPRRARVAAKRPHHRSGHQPDDGPDHQQGPVG